MVAARQVTTSEAPDDTARDEFVAAELRITARQIELGCFRGVDGKALTPKEAQERMARSERYLLWRWEERHG